ncbi:hypothetical protein GCM10020369_28520 [Cryptosporangium minutisporangium]|uniref:Uncharacterized protein n=1 Tax=Cryptosporangium minutisporangium TaxID=113569 RepID=A0ABP6SXY8_9ACTN
MARNIFPDESGRRALGIVQVAATVPLPAAPRPGLDVGATHVEATAWAVSWSYAAPEDAAAGAVRVRAAVAR